METARTIAEAKAAFLRNQVQILTAPISPQEGWRDYGPETEDDISDKVVEEVLQKVNAQLRQHSRVVYSTQAIHHVARQIESLYWQSVRSEGLLPETASSGVEVGSDLTSHLVIEKLPPQYAGDAASPEDRQKYEALYKRLVELDQRRQRQQQRLAQYRQLEALLAPLRDPVKNIQPNLITREGELVKEIDRMRMLAARVVGRISQARVVHEKDWTEEASQMDPERKLAAVLESSSSANV